jgi:hypothetical protein
MKFHILMPFRALGAAFRSIDMKVRGFRALCTPAEEAKRFKKCKICPFLLENQQCGACGCWIPAKIMLTAEKCPKNKWGAIFSRQKGQNSRTV